MSDINQGTQAETDNVRTKPECRQRGYGSGCHHGGGWRKAIVVVLLVGIGVLVGRATIGHHMHHGPWSYAPWGVPMVTNGQSVPMEKLLDDIGATPEQRQKASAALTGK